jgi:hypothetical protein
MAVAYLQTTDSKVASSTDVFILNAIIHLRHARMMASHRCCCAWLPICAWLQHLCWHQRLSKLDQ